MPRLDPASLKHDANADHLGQYHAVLLSDSGGLTRFGAFLETLSPGSSSARPQWHAREYEMVHVMTGRPTLIEGDTATFKAGVPVGHYIRNDTDRDAAYLVTGTRSGDDIVTYTENGDILTIKDGIKTLRNARGDILKTAPYHGA